MEKDFPENSSIILGLPATNGRAVCVMRIYQTKLKKKKKTHIPVKMPRGSMRFYYYTVQ